MTDLLHDVDAPSDAELISRVRGGDVAAYGELFSRHVDAAKRLSRQLVRGPDADDLVSEAFAKVLTVLQGGGGPDVAFRAYLLTSVRRLHVDRIRSGSRLQTSDDMEAFDPGVPFQDTAVAAFESGAAAKAFASLPERWQLVLWHLEVEGQKPADVAPLLGMSPNSVSALAYRAREGLRQAFLTMHLNDISETDCRWVNEHLGAYVRNGLAKRESTKVQAHLDECRRCTAMYLELTEVNSNLRAILGPLLLGAAATGYLASSGTAAGGLGLSAMFGRVRDTISANAGAATAGAVAAGVAAVATAGIMLLPSSGPDTVTGADRPIGTVSPPGGPGGTATTNPGGDKGKPSPTEASTPEVSPAAVLPSVLPGPSELPAAQVADQPAGTDQPAGADQGSPDQGGTDQGNPDQGSPGGDGTTSPSDPSREPSPTEPSPTEPSPTEPSPTEPSPTEPSPTAPTPTETPPPPPVTYTLQVNNSKIENGEVTFDLTGDPLPPTVFLQIESPPAGITFGTGSDTCVRVADLVAECTTTPPTSTVLQPLARAVSLALSEPVRVSMPFSGAPAVDTDVTIALSAPLGNVLQRVTTLYDVPDPAATADVALALPDTVTTTDVHEYDVTATVSGVPNTYKGPATFTLTSLAGADGPRATFVGDDRCKASADGQTLECATITNGPMTFTVYVKDNSVDTPVKITLAPLSGLDDPKPADNTASTTLKARRPAADLALSATPNFDGNSGKGTVTASITGAPDSPVVLTTDFDPLGLTFTSLPAGCTASNAAVTCTTRGPTPGPMTFGVALVDRPATFTTETIHFAVSAPGYDETDPTDNTADVVLPRLKGSEGTETKPRVASSSTGTQSSTLVGDVVDTAGDDLTVQRTTKKTNQLLNATETQVAQTSKKDAKAPKATAKLDSKPAKADGKAAGKGVDKPTQPAPAPPVPTDPPGNGKGNSNGQGNANGNGNGKKDDPSPVEQVVDTLTSLLP